MNGIERLEEIKSRVWKDKGTYAMGDYSQREGYIYTLSDYDYEWLIEQAERVQELETTVDFYQSALRDADRRVQELENHIDHLYDNNVHLKGDYRLQEQNKRYREALEEIKSLYPLRNAGYQVSEIRKIVIKALEESE